MCGIAGVLNAQPIGEPHRVGLSAMRLALRHRGPDGEGEWQSPCAHAAFGHARLAIFDPSPAAAQPMSTADGRFTITYNGAIYNHARLRRALEQRGAPFRTTSDTEVILRLFQERGSEAIGELRGMFAFAVWDAQTRRCVLARDPSGIKPLYYAHVNGTLVFASEVQALRRSGLVSAELDPFGIYGYFRSGSVPEPHTLLRDITCLPAGHHLTWQDGRTDVEQFWQLRFDADCPPDTAVTETRRVLEESVAGHFAGDAPAGVLLSGGVDSSAILALAHAAGRRGVKTFSLSFPGTADDEGPIARRIAERFDAEHFNCPMDSDATLGAFADYVAATDQPSIDGLNTFVIARVVRRCGVRVVLSGIGADELFGGYPSFARVPRLAAWHQRFHWTGTMGQRLGRLAASAATGPRTRRIADMLSRAPSLDNAYQTYRGVFTHQEAATLTRHYLGAAVELPDPASDVDSDADGPNAVTRFELTRYVRNQLLRDADVMSMAAGVELRTPFLDAEVVAHLLRIPAAVRLEPHKALLRRAVPELPAWIAHQPKRCFQFPFAQWPDAGWREMLSSLPLNGAFASTWYRRWCMFVMESWMSKVNRAGDVNV